MEWIDDFFGEKYLDIHLPLLTDDITNEDVTFVEEVLELSKGSFILDVPCGFGRHSISLAKKGYNVTGIDFKKHFIDMAIENSKDIKNVTFVQSDMRKISYKNKFNAVINLFTSFGYFDEEGNYEFLKQASISLKKGGKLLIDILNREWAIHETEKNNLVWLLYPNNTVFLAKNKFDVHKGRWYSDQLIVQHGKTYKQRQDVRLYSYTEMRDLLRSVGLEIIHVYGSKKKTQYTKDEKHMIVIAQKT